RKVCADDRRQSLPYVVTGKPVLTLLDQAPLFGPAVDRAGQRRTEPFFVGSALVGVDGVGEGVHRLGERGVPLHGHLETHVAVRVNRVGRDNALVGRVLAGVEVRHIIDQPTLIAEPALDAARGALDGIGATVYRV